MVSSSATTQNVCSRHISVMEMMTVVIILMKIQGMPVDLHHSGINSQAKQIYFHQAMICIKVENCNFSFNF